MPESSSKLVEWVVAGIAATPLLGWTAMRLTKMVKLHYSNPLARTSVVIELQDKLEQDTEALSKKMDTLFVEHEKADQARQTEQNTANQARHDGLVQAIFVALGPDKEKT